MIKASWKKPFGVIAILLLIVVWAVLVASLAGIVGKWPISGQSLFYVVAGIIWILPLKPMLKWMEADQSRRED